MIRFKFWAYWGLHGLALLCILPRPSRSTPSQPEYEKIEGILVQKEESVFSTAVVSSAPVVAPLVSLKPARHRIFRRKATIPRSSPLETSSTQNRELPPKNPFRFFENILLTSDRSVPLSDHLRKDNLLLELHSMAPWEDQFLLKLSLQNLGSQDFFVSSVSLFANGRSIPVELLMPFCCRAGGQIIGLIKIPSRLVVGRTVSLTLSESGNEYRKLTVQKIQHDF